MPGTRSTPLREFKIIEELKCGMHFLKGFLDVYAFSNTLSMLADTIVQQLVHYLHGEKGFAVIGLGGFGAEDLNIGSDLDLLFIRLAGNTDTVSGKGYRRRVDQISFGIHIKRVCL